VKLTCQNRHSGVEVLDDFHGSGMKCGVCGLPLAPDTVLDPLYPDLDKVRFKQYVSVAGERAMAEVTGLFMKSAAESKKEGGSMLLITAALVGGIFTAAMERHLTSLVSGAPLEKVPVKPSVADGGLT
jgi:hypothetical protein